MSNKLLALNLRQVVTHGLAIVSLFVVLIPGYAQESTDQNLCEIEQGYAIVFFNGVGNTVKDANKGLLALKQKLGYGDTYNNQPVVYEAFINTTGTENDSRMLQDVAEVVRQSIAEGDALSANRWQLFWESLGNRSRFSFGQILVGALSGESRSAFLDWVESSLATRQARLHNWFTSQAFTPPTAADYVRQHTRIKSLALEGKKILMIAHSQGNLFVNQAYDVAVTVEGFSADNLAVVHIAPASSTLRGQHILADRDKVIGALVSVGGVIIPDSNVQLPLAHVLPVFGKDPTGHYLIETYLNSDLETLPLVRNLVESALQSLVDSETEGSEGFFTATLTWDGSGDVDLHIEEPDRNHVFYINRQGNSGNLDVDNTTGFGPEHYFSSCDPASLQTGFYRFGVNNFRNATGRKYTLQISSSRGGELRTQNNIDVGPELGFSGNSNPNYGTGITVLVTEENGEFRVFPM